MTSTTQTVRCPNSRNILPIYRKISEPVFKPGDTGAPKREARCPACEQAVDILFLTPAQGYVKGYYYQDHTVDAIDWGGAQ